MGIPPPQPPRGTKHVYISRPPIHHFRNKIETQPSQLLQRPQGLLLGKGKEIGQ